MSVYENVLLALRRPLVEHADKPAVKWEGESYTPTTGTPWVRESVSFYPDELRSIPATDGLIRMSGLYFLDLFYPPNEGVRPAMAFAQVLRGLYKHGSGAMRNGQLVRFYKFHRAQVREGVDWLHLPCTVQWRSDAQNADM